MKTVSKDIRYLCSFGAMGDGTNKSGIPIDPDQSDPDPTYSNKGIRVVRQFQDKKWYTGTILQSDWVETKRGSKVYEINYFVTYDDGQEQGYVKNTIETMIKDFEKGKYKADSSVQKARTSVQKAGPSKSRRAEAEAIVRESQQFSQDGRDTDDPVTKLLDQKIDELKTYTNYSDDVINDLIKEIETRAKTIDQEYLFANSDTERVSIISRFKGFLDNFDEEYIESAQEDFKKEELAKQEKAAKAVAAKAQAKATRSANIRTTTIAPDRNVEIDLYKIFLENYGFTFSYNQPIPDEADIERYAQELWGIRTNVPDLLKQKQMKWYCCFATLFYLDQLHDFMESSRGDLSAAKEQELALSMNRYLHKNLYTVIASVYPSVTQGLDPLSDSFYQKQNNAYNNYFDTLNKIFENVGIQSDMFDDPTNLYSDEIFFASNFDDAKTRNLTYLDVEYLGHGWKNLEGFKFILCESMIFNKILNPWVNSYGDRTVTLGTLYRGKKETNKIGVSQSNLQIFSEYCIAIMGIARIDFKKLKRTVFNDINSKFNDRLIKFILYYNNHTSDPTTISKVNSPFIKNGYTPPSNYVVAVDALGSPSKTNPITSILNTYVEFENKGMPDLNDPTQVAIGPDEAPRLNHGRKLIYFNSIADEIDGASTKNILKNTFNTDLEGLYKSRPGIPYENTINHVEQTDVNTKFTLYFTGYLNVQNVMSFTFYNLDTGKMLQVDTFFSIGIPSTITLDQNGSIDTSVIFAEVKKDKSETSNVQDDSLKKGKGKGKSSKTAKTVVQQVSRISLSKVKKKIENSSKEEGIYWSTYKTVLDFSKTTYFWNFVNKSDYVNNTDYNILMMYNDIIAADKSALFIPGSLIIEGAENYGEFFDFDFKLFLRNYQLRAIWEGKQDALFPNLRNPSYVVSALQPRLLTPYIQYPANIGGFGKRKIIHVVDTDIRYLKNLK